LQVHAIFSNRDDTVGLPINLQKNPLALLDKGGLGWVCFLYLLLFTLFDLSDLITQLLHHDVLEVGKADFLALAEQVVDLLPSDIRVLIE